MEFTEQYSTWRNNNRCITHKAQSGCLNGDCDHYMTENGGNYATG